MSSIEGYFKAIDIYSINENIFQSIGNEWMLITAGTPEKFNMMTASWGTMGILWNKPITICFIRPTRFTYELIEKSDYYTLSFFNKEHKKILQFCGSASGRNVDKTIETDLKPIPTKNGSITYKQARIVFECKKLYADDLKRDNFVISELANINYAQNDYHRIYIGEIVNCYKAI